MTRAARRQSELARLKEENRNLNYELGKAQGEINQLRDAARQLMAGLSEYAKAENWKVIDFSITWQGEGDGPAVARKFLGLDSKEERN